VTRLPVTLTQVDELADGIRRLRFLVPDHYRFLAGQYLLLCPDAAEDGIPFSIASAPASLPTLELHFGETPGNPDSERLLQLITSWQRGEAIRPGVSPADGTVTLVGPTARPLVLVVGGTGLAQAHSLIAHLRGVEQRLPVTLFHHCASADGLYLDAELKALDQALPWFHYEPRVAVLSRDDNPLTNAEAWLQQEFNNASNADVILCGAPDFVFTISDAIRDLNLLPHSLQADAFSYAARS
jgi:NAD(P)H-flavin reductase